MVVGAAFGLQLALVIGFAVIFGFVVLVPWTLDLWLAHGERMKALEIAKDKGPSETATAEGSEWPGTRGLSRASMAMSVIVVVGFALLYLLVVNPFTDAGKLATNIVIALTTTLAAIVAFYFGSKVAQESAEQAAKPKEPAQPEPKPATNGTTRVEALLRELAGR